MACNPWSFVKFELGYCSGQPIRFELFIILSKKDIRGGFYLGRKKEERFLLAKDIDFSIKERLYWNNIFMSLFHCREKWNICIPQKNIDATINTIREYRYYHRLPRAKSYDDRYPKHIVQWAFNRINKEIDDLCKDNFRIARLGDRKAIKRYRQQQDNGCCGFFDIICMCPWDLKKYKIGCNYGH